MRCWCLGDESVVDDERGDGAKVCCRYREAKVCCRYLWVKVVEHEGGRCGCLGDESVVDDQRGDGNRHHRYQLRERGPPAHQSQPNFSTTTRLVSALTHPGGTPGANLKPIAHRCQSSRPSFPPERRAAPRAHSPSSFQPAASSRLSFPLAPENQSQPSASPTTRLVSALTGLQACHPGGNPGVNLESISHI